MSVRDDYQIACRTIMDGILLGFCGLLILLALVSPSRVPNPTNTIISLSVAGLSYAIAARLIITRMNEKAALALYTVAVLAILSFFFSIVSRFQHVIIEGWMDETLLGWERSITGTETTRVLERYTTPALTEWMMFAYVLYIPLLPALAVMCFRAGGSRAASEYLMNLAMVNILCFIGFIVFPVAGPLCYEPVEYSVPLQGGIFTWTGEWIRSNAHYPGGCLPSPHCAATTVMLVMLYRWNRAALALLLPPLITIYVATVYGRYHYAGDAVAGLLTATTVMLVTPCLMRYAVKSLSSRRVVSAGEAVLFDRT